MCDEVNTKFHCRLQMIRSIVSVFGNVHFDLDFVLDVGVNENWFRQRQISIIDIANRVLAEQNSRWIALLDGNFEVVLNWHITIGVERRKDDVAQN